MTDNRTTELLPCPFCGGSVSIIPCIGDLYDENDEIVGNSYAWIISHNDFKTTCDLRHFSVSGIYRTLDCAEANEQKQRLIDAWNQRHVETCEIESSFLNDFSSNHECWFEFDLSCGHHITSDVMEPPNHCPNCGAKVVG